MPTISPALLFAGNGEEALDYYRGVFPQAVVSDVNRYGAGAPMPEGTMLAATITIEGLRFTLINGPDEKFTDAVSFMIHVDGQEEVDYYWDAFTKDGEENWCGWLRDRFGLAWQIVPTEMNDLLSDQNPARQQAAMQAMMQMKKIVLADMRAAADAAVS